MYDGFERVDGRGLEYVRGVGDSTIVPDSAGAPGSTE